MNAMRGMLRLSLRGYRTNSRGTSAGRAKPKRTIEMTQPGMPVQDIFADLEDPDDIDQYESDFRNVAEYDRMHERELEIAKAKLKTQIVKRKYFKAEEPSMLTWGEKEQIRLLHDEDPEEWTPEKISESFPVSRDGALKVLRSRWSPRSADVVTRYEKSVKENWALFKAGKLQMDPRFEAHLQKFRDRQIKPTDPETVAKMLKPKPVFPNPRSTLFTSIIQSYLEANPPSRDDEDDEIATKKSTKSESFDRVTSENSQSQQKIESFDRVISEDFKLSQEQKSEETAIARKSRKLATEEKVSRFKPVTFDEFLRGHVESQVLEDKMTPVDRVLVDELKSQGTEAYKKKSLIFESESAVAGWKREGGLEKKDEKSFGKEEKTLISEKEEAAFIFEKEEIASISEKEEISAISEREGIAETRLAPEARLKQLEVAKSEADLSVNPERASKLEGSVETGIIAREKTEAAMQDDYPDRIHIPAKKYKPGVTYRVEDRYYDDDGELLYRVPGLKA